MKVFTWNTRSYHFDEGGLSGGMMNNPVLNRMETEWTDQARMTQAAKSAAHPMYDQQAFNQAQEAYAGPAADAVSMGRMTYDDVIVKTGIALATVMAFAAGAWYLASSNTALVMALMLVGFIGGFVLAMVNIFSKTIRPALILAYSALEGVALGALSFFVEAMVPGVVWQAVVATFAVFGVTLALFSSGKVRNSPKMQKFVLISLVGLIVSRLLIWVVSMFIPAVGGYYTVEFAGIPLTVIVSVFAVFVGALSLISDFDQVKVGVQAGAPAKYSWMSAFGIMVTLIWMYTEILNILARMNSR